MGILASQLLYLFCRSARYYTRSYSPALRRRRWTVGAAANHAILATVAASLPQATTGRGCFWKGFCHCWTTDCCDHRSSSLSRRSQPLPWTWRGELDDALERRIHPPASDHFLVGISIGRMPWPRKMGGEGGGHDAVSSFTRHCPGLIRADYLRVNAFFCF